MKTEGREVVRAAVVQTAPIAFNREQTVEKVRSLVHDAARQGAQLVVFPEAFLSAYPRGMHFGAVIGSRTPEGRDAFYRYWESAVDIPGPTMSVLADIAQTSQVYLVIGIIERAGGTLYCTVVFFAPTGQYLGKHRKVMPTAAERIVWGCGDGSTLPVFDTPLGKLGAVICWENYMPLLRMTMYTKGIELYCAPTADGRANWLHSMQHIALEGRCFVLSCNQFARRSDYPKDYTTPFGDDPNTILSRGGSCIVSPLGEVLAGPVFDMDALLIADLDRKDIIRGKMDFDVVGHYARPDLFHLSVNEQAYQAEKGFLQARSLAINQHERRFLMNLIFQDQAFSFELLRAVGYTVYDGADIGECLATAARIAEGDFESWHTEWSRTARRVQKIAEHCLDQGHRVSARKAFLRASNYYRTAEFFLHTLPDDPRILTTWQASRDCFALAATLFPFPCEAIEMTYEGSSLPGYLYCVDRSGTPRPTLLFHGGFDSTVEELYFAGAAAALEHGYNCLTFDGPGQGRAIRQQSLPFRPDWEAVVTPVIDYALSRPEVDPTRLALMGMSQGGYFAPRAAAFEPRIKALIAYDGVFNCYDALHGLVPPVVASLIEQGPSEAVDALLHVMSTLNPGVRWALTNGMWTYQAATPRAFLNKMRAYTLEDCVQQIACPTLVLAAENDHFFRGQPETLYERLCCPKTFLRFTAEEGAEEHCHEGAMTLFHQRLFDWLDNTWAQHA